MRTVKEIQQKIAELQMQLDQVRGEEKLVKLQKELSKERQELKRLRSPPEPRKSFTTNSLQNNPKKDLPTPPKVEDGSQSI